MHAGLRPGLMPDGAERAGQHATGRSQVGRLAVCPLDADCQIQITATPLHVVWPQCRYHLDVVLAVVVLGRALGVGALGAVS